MHAFFSLDNAKGLSKPDSEEHLFTIRWKL